MIFIPCSQQDFSVLFDHTHNLIQLVLFKSPIAHYSHRFQSHSRFCPGT